MKNIFIVVEDNAEYGIDTFLFDNEDAARECFNGIIADYKNQFKDFGDYTEINDTWASITDQYENEVARVLLQEKIIN